MALYYRDPITGELISADAPFAYGFGSVIDVFASASFAEPSAPRYRRRPWRDDATALHRDAAHVVGDLNAAAARHRPSR